MDQSTVCDQTKNCFFLVAENGKQDVWEHLKPFRPVFNGAGWFIEGKHRHAAEQISRLAEMRLMEWPLNGETFESIRRKSKRAYIQEKAIKERLLIDGLKSQLGIQTLDNQELTQGELCASLDSTLGGKQLLDSLKKYEHLQDQIKYAENEEKIAQFKPHILSILPIEDRITSHHKTLEKYRGKKHLGLCVKAISEFNEKMLGLRKLMLIAAAPNVGKTALTVQLAAEVLLTEPDACLVYVSLEMDAEEIFTRVVLYLSELSFETYVLGSQRAEGEGGYHNFFSAEESRKIDSATKTVTQIGDRLQIIDMASCNGFSAAVIIEHVERLKNQTGCSRAIVVVDYLQVWPAPPQMKFSSDTEADKWRIGELKKIRDALNEVNQDPVIVISEARKPSESGNAWGGDLSDVMGSARGTYTPDAVLLLCPLPEAELGKLWKKMKMPEVTFAGDVNDFEDSKDSSHIKAFLAGHGIAICCLKMPKGRDGMKKFNTLLAFHFFKNRFEKINWAEMRLLAGKNRG